MARKKASSKKPPREIAAVTGESSRTRTADARTVEDAFIEAVGKKLVDLLTELGLIDKALEIYAQLSERMPLDPQTGERMLPRPAQLRSIVMELLQPGVVSRLRELAAEILVLAMKGKGKVKRGRTAHA